MKARRSSPSGRTARAARSTRRGLSDAVRAAAGALLADGVRQGDRVVAVVPYSVESVVIGLAAAAVGATFASASPDFGEDALVDRFGQLDPAVLVTTGQHSYAGKQHDTVARAAALADRLGVRRGVMIGADPTAAGGVSPGACGGNGTRGSVGRRRTPSSSCSRTTTRGTCCSRRAPPASRRPSFIAPVGVLLKHVSEHVLHSDIHRGDIVFQFTTTGWMMWNWAVSALASGATVVSYDGSPFHPGPTALWDVVESERVTMFGTSAKYLDECAKVGLEPRLSHRLDSVRTISSTGSPLSTDRFAWVYEVVASDVHLASVSGGTDLCGCLVAGYPTEPVRAGVIQGPALGVAADVVDDDGTPVVEQQGELVVDRPYPSQPLGFVDDADGSRYRSAYYEHFPGRWHQGDRTTRTVDGGFVIHGRSDATLNPGGVRIGTAEIYRTVDRHPAVVDSIAVPRIVGDDQVIVLFVRLSDGYVLDDSLTRRLAGKDPIGVVAPPRPGGHRPGQPDAAHEVGQAGRGRRAHDRQRWHRRRDRCPRRRRQHSRSSSTTPASPRSERRQPRLHLATSPPPLSSTMPGNTRRRNGSSRSTLNAPPSGPSFQAGMMAGS